MTTNTTAFGFTKAFRKATNSLREQYYNGEISREEYEDLIEKEEYIRSENVMNAMDEELAM